MFEKPKAGSGVEMPSDEQVKEVQGLIKGTSLEGDAHTSDTVAAWINGEDIDIKNFIEQRKALVESGEAGAAVMNPEAEVTEPIDESRKLNDIGA